jgi:hypothetical protein
MTKRSLLTALLIALLSVVLVSLLYSPLSSVEDQVTSLKYRLRGEVLADTNIIIVLVGQFVETSTP